MVQVMRLCIDMFGKIRIWEAFSTKILRLSARNILREAKIQPDVAAFQDGWIVQGPLSLQEKTRLGDG